MCRIKVINFRSTVCSWSAAGCAAYDISTVCARTRKRTLRTAALLKETKKEKKNVHAFFISSRTKIVHFGFRAPCGFYVHTVTVRYMSYVSISAVFRGRMGSSLLNDRRTTVFGPVETNPRKRPTRARRIVYERAGHVLWRRRRRVCEAWTGRAR